MLSDTCGKSGPVCLRISCDMYIYSLFLWFPGDSHDQTPNGSIISNSTETPKPLHRSRLPTQRAGETDPGRPGSDSKFEQYSEVDVGKLVVKLQDGGAKFGNKAANGVVTGTAALKTSILHSKRPAPRPVIYGKEGEFSALGSLPHTDLSWPWMKLSPILLHCRNRNQTPQVFCVLSDCRGRRLAEGAAIFATCASFPAVQQ